MMRRLRRSAGALLGILLLQLSLLGAGVGCSAPQRVGTAATQTDRSAEHMQHGDHGAARAPAGDLLASGAPVGALPLPHHDGQLHCSTAMACATAVAPRTAASAVPDGSAFADARIAAPNSAAPASILGAPEPPPPRG